MRLLLIEDDALLGASLKKALGYAGYSVEWVRDGYDGADAAVSGDFDILLIDANLPHLSGFDIINKVRSASLPKTPYMIMVTARGGVQDKIRGLDSGADDYMTKPFDMDELLARLRAVTRRTGSQIDTLLDCRDFQMNLNTHQIIPKNGSEPFIPSAHEFIFLSTLMRHPGQIFSKSRLEETLYGWEGTIDSNVIEVIVYNLRKRLGKQSIMTVRGVGYMVSP